MAFLTAGFIDGSRVKAEVLRRQTWITSGGASGVADTGSLKVVALGTPGSAVLINPGGGIVATKFPDAPAIQSYTIANDAAYQLSNLGNSSSSPVTWEVVARVIDPQYAGNPTPADPQTNAYTVAEAVSSLPVGKPYLWLATIVVPGNTAAITQAMITDRRKLARARQQIEPARTVRPTVPNDMFYGTNGADYRPWPTETAIGGNKQSYLVPEWATKLSIRIDAAAIYALGSAPVFGGMRIKFNGVVSTHAILYAETTPTRINAIRTWTFDVPANLRGTTVDIEIEGNNSSGSPRILRADNQSDFVWNVTWLETL